MNTLIDANVACLSQGMEFLQAIPPDLYCQKCPDVFGSSIGGHLRHNLDHYLAFASGQPSGEIDYDDRHRSEAIETDRAAAIRVLREVAATMEGLRATSPDQPLRIRMDDGGDSTWSETTLRRELQFLLSHTIHHYALIVSIATRFGFDQFPEAFGIAPSTVHHLEKKGA